MDEGGAGIRGSIRGGDNEDRVEGEDAAGGRSRSRIERDIGMVCIEDTMGRRRDELDMRVFQPVYRRLGGEARGLVVLIARLN